MARTTGVLPPGRRRDLLPQLRSLLAQLSPSVAELSDEAVCDDGLPVAVASLSVVPTAGLGPVGHVDDVVVDEAERGRGTGRQLMEAVRAEAERLGLRHLDLTSRPSREAANALYLALGYERRETNAYRLRLQP